MPNLGNYSLVFLGTDIKLIIKLIMDLLSADYLRQRQLSRDVLVVYLDLLGFDLGESLSLGGGYGDVPSGTVSIFTILV